GRVSLGGTVAGLVRVRSVGGRPAGPGGAPGPAGAPPPGPGGGSGPPVAIDLVEDAVLFLVENDRATPLSLPVALLLNYVATMVSPASLHGDFLSPFARLSFAQKARTLEMVETAQSELAVLIDSQVPEPLKQ